MAESMLSMIYACRAGKWDILLEYKQVIFYVFAYVHLNYPQYVTGMLSDMLALEELFPGQHFPCISGNFTIQHGENPFSQTKPGIEL